MNLEEQGFLRELGDWLRRRRERRKRIISIVGLTREPVSFDPVILATVACKAWNADLGNGQESLQAAWKQGGASAKEDLQIALLQGPAAKATLTTALVCPFSVAFS